MLIAVIALGIAAVGWFNAIAVIAEGDSLVHATVLAFAQFGVLALASKVSLALNWERFDRSTHRIVHVFAHTALLFVMVGATGSRRRIPSSFSCCIRCRACRSR